MNIHDPVTEAVILAAGQGTRMRPLTCRRPKPLIPILNKPFLQHQLELLETSGVDRVVLIVGHMKQVIEDWIENRPTGMEVETKIQVEARGTGDAINTARGSVGGDFVVMNGDILLDPPSLSAMLKSGITSVAAKEVENPQDYGVFRVDGDMVRGVVEKAENPPSNLANVGCYVFKADIFDRIDATEPNPKRGEVEITDTLQSMVEEGLPIRCFAVQEWNELGKPWDVLNLTEIYLPGLVEMIDPDSTIDGTIDQGVLIGTGTVIESGSRVIGPSIIGDNCLIRDGTTVGPNSTVGEGSTLDGCIVEGSVLMDGCRIGDGSRIEHSVLASGVVVESEASLSSARPDGRPVMLDIKGRPTSSGRIRLGSIVGDSCRIGAGTKLEPGTMLEPDTEVLVRITER